MDFYKIEDMFKEMVVEGADKTQSHCPETFLKGDFSLMIRSACPWYLEKTVDNDRYPKEMYRAKSNCKTCIGSNGQQHCERIYHHVKTLQRSECVNGVYQYEERSEFIPIAFACAQRLEIENNKINNTVQQL